MDLWNEAALLEDIYYRHHLSSAYTHNTEVPYIKKLPHTRSDTLDPDRSKVHLMTSSPYTVYSILNLPEHFLLWEPSGSGVPPYDIRILSFRHSDHFSPTQAIQNSGHGHGSKYRSTLRSLRSVESEPPPYEAPCRLSPQGLHSVSSPASRYSAHGRGTEFLRIFHSWLHSSTGFSKLPSEDSSRPYQESDYL